MKVRNSPARRLGKQRAATCLTEADWTGHAMEGDGTRWNASQDSSAERLGSAGPQKGYLVKRTRILALFCTVAIMAAASMAFASPASADTTGPVQNQGNGLCF